MKKLLFTILFLFSLNTVYAQAVNWYIWIINNSSKTITINANDSSYWDNRGWDSCNTNWSSSNHISPNSSMLKCGGTNNRSVRGWFSYLITVTNNSGNSIFKQSQSLDVYNDMPGSLNIKTSEGKSSSTLRNFKIDNGTNDKDAIVVYVFDDEGFSTTLFKYGDQYSYDVNTKSLNMLNKKCQDPDYSGGCTIYQKYSQ